MEIQDRLEDKNALSPILVTVEVRHTLAILWSSESIKRVIINIVKKNKNYECG